MLLWIVLIVLLLMALGGGVYAGPRYGVGVGWSPLGVVILIVIILLLTGNL